LKSVKKILITGATGCLGMNLAKTLGQKGYQTLGLGRNHTMGSILENMGCNFLNSDIRSPIPSENLACDLIVHCAALSSPQGTYQEHYKANVIGTKNVINLAHKLNAGLIHVSTPSIYFSFKDQSMIKEDSPLPKTFASNYSHTKYEAERLVMQAHREGLKTVIIRPRGIFGEYDNGIVPRILRITKSGLFPLVRDGQLTIDLTYVGNVVHAIDLCIDKMESVNGEVFNITNDSPRILKNILELLFSKLNKKVRYINLPYSVLYGLALCFENLSKAMSYCFEPPITTYTLGLISYSQTLNIDKAKQKLGYRPLLTIEEGMDNFLKWRSSL
jgi:nucleoside-diphosphate-sugar epimerase